MNRTDDDDAALLRNHAEAIAPPMALSVDAVTARGRRARRRRLVGGLVAGVAGVLVVGGAVVELATPHRQVVVDPARWAPGPVQDVRDVLGPFREPVTSGDVAPPQVSRLQGFETDQVRRLPDAGAAHAYVAAADDQVCFVLALPAGADAWSTASGCTSLDDFAARGLPLSLHVADGAGRGTASAFLVPDVFRAPDEGWVSAASNLWVPEHSASRPADSGEPGTADTDAADEPTDGADITVTDAALIDAFVRFAQQPDRATANALPLAPGGVELGLGPTLVRTLPVQLVSDPEAWLLETDGFRARSGPVSALTVLQEHLAEPDGAQRLGTGLQTSVGEHPHCASPPVPAPAGLADARRVSVQPAEDSITTCLAWFSVDLFLADDGTVVAVTVDLYEP
nr:hypothetical protein [uncultured Actinotalea sp.]